MTSIEQIHHPIALLDNLQGIEERIASVTRVSLFLDFDGTISGIVVNPGDDKLDPEIRSILKTLNERWDFDVSIIS
ncbi:MAG: hypothetical protein ACR2IV_14675, partial [Bryobacteraceae bacterium]